MMASIRILSVCLLLSAAAHGHHSTALNFSQETITLRGRILSTEWVNPHCYFVLEVADEDGDAEEWLVEMLARIAFERQGFEFEALEVGMVVEVTGRLGYDGNNMYFRQAILPDGRTLIAPGPL